MKLGRTAHACFMAMAMGLGMAAGHAAAQINPFGRSPNMPRLDPEDRRLLWDSADALNNATPSEAGASRNWHNPKSGNSGTVTLQRVFRANSMPCHALHYTVTLAAQQTQRTYDINWCRIQTGEWKIAE